MCRIFGFLSAGFDHLDRKIFQVSESQFHGGPDEQEIVAFRQYGIGSNRLAITDPEGGKQPYSQIPGIYVVLNGEVYNHDDLRAELEADGYHFADRCDGTILPALYQKYGSAFAEYLDGMFTIAVLDLREKTPTFVLVSDTSGIKPVYFSYNSRTTSFAFATEIPALMKFGITPDTLWRQGVDHYLTTRTVTGRPTMIEGLQSLPSGSILRIRLGEEPRIETYRSRIRYDGPIPTTLAEASGIFRELLSQEVRKLSKADARVCTVNSGGLDSSLITSLMHQQNGRDVTSFHVACKGNWPFDERAYAQELASRCGITHHEAFVDPNEIPDLIPRMVYHLGQPNCAPHALSTLRLFEKVSAEGFRVALTGEGSDELFCGHDRMGQAIRDQSPLWISNYLDRMSPCPADIRDTLYTAEYRQELGQHGHRAKTEMASYIDHLGGTRSERIRHFEQKFSLAYYILHRVEPLAMASGVEVRVPYCQPRIMDFAWRVNADLFINGQDRGKAVVYGAAEGLVPQSIWDRPKQPFTLPVISLMHKGSRLMDYTRETLLGHAMRKDGIFDAAGLEALIRMQEERPRKETAFTLWALMVYGVWRAMLAQQNDTTAPSGRSDDAGTPFKTKIPVTL